MKNVPHADNRETTEERTARRVRTGVRATLAFGVIAATIEMGVILWMARC